ncbi:HET-domain-containing protein, partial [Thozetella sp. PMI_491]
MRPFRYEQLGLPDSEIRLLDLLPGQGRVRCRLRKMALETARGQYEPLSYCWGDQKQQVTMIVDDGRALSIGLSLDAALRRLRFEQNRVRTLWVDAVCINQNDLPEKNIQVQLMTRIYQNGCRTLIWLGEHD